MTQTARPKDIAAMLMQIVAEECHSELTWSQHPDPITDEELQHVINRVSKYLFETKTGKPVAVRSGARH